MTIIIIITLSVKLNKADTVAAHKSAENTCISVVDFRSLCREHVQKVYLSFLKTGAHYYTIGL